MGTALTVPDVVCLLDMAVLPRVNAMGPLAIKHGGASLPLKVCNHHAKERQK